MANNYDEIFIYKLLASLKINGCNIIDISDENINSLINELKNIFEKYNFDYNLNHLCENNYLCFYNIINNLDPLIGEIENDNLYLTMDKKSTALLLLNDINDEKFSFRDILKIGKDLKKFMDEKKVKVMWYENYK